MATQSKIKIKDNAELRSEIDKLYENTNQIDLAKWSLKIAKRILRVTSIDYKKIDVIKEGFKVNELWQRGKARMHDVRQVGFKIHKLAHDSDSEIQKSAFRTVGQAVASGHMKEHAMVASDYAIKTIGLNTNNDANVITKERKWQLDELNKIHNRAQVDAFQPIVSLIGKSEKVLQKLRPSTWQYKMTENNLKALRIASALKNNETKNFPASDLREALLVIASMISKVEKAQAKLSSGTSQYTLAKNRIKAFRLASTLINKLLITR